MSKIICRVNAERSFALTDEKFKAFVFESSFLDRYKVDAATLKKIKADEVELLKFGLKWLKGVLFKVEESEKVPIQEGAEKARKESKKEN